MLRKQEPNLFIKANRQIDQAAGKLYMFSQAFINSIDKLFLFSRLLPHEIMAFYFRKNSQPAFSPVHLEHEITVHLS